MHSTNFSELNCDPVEASVRREVARGHAGRIMDKGIRDYSQWFQGILNQVADSLSRDHDRSDIELTKILKIFVPSQLPKRFKIAPLPKEIIS